MNYRNPTFNKRGTIDVEIEHPIFGWIPFTATPDDVEPFGRAVYAELIDKPVAPYAGEKP